MYSSILLIGLLLIYYEIKYDILIKKSIKLVL